MNRRSAAEFFDQKVKSRTKMTKEQKIAEKRAKCLAGLGDSIVLRIFSGVLRTISLSFFEARADKQSRKN